MRCGLIAGPLYVGVSLAQALTRDGFDPTRHAWSLLGNGDLGWIQILNLLTTGALTIACAVGIRRVLRGQRGGTWGPILIGVYGAGMMAAGVFTADPADGFPRVRVAGEVNGQPVFSDAELPEPLRDRRTSRRDRANRLACGRCRRARWDRRRARAAA